MVTEILKAEKSKLIARLSEISKVIETNKEDIVGREAKRIEVRWLKSKIEVFDKFLKNSDDLPGFYEKQLVQRTSLSREVRDLKKRWEKECDDFPDNLDDDEKMDELDCLCRNLHVKEAQYNAYSFIMPLISKHISNGN